jgi:hypothetical protein
MSITSVQYSSALLLISSLLLMNCTLVRSMPTAFHTCAQHVTQMLNICVRDVRGISQQCCC